MRLEHWETSFLKYRRGKVPRISRNIICLAALGFCAAFPGKNSQAAQAVENKSINLCPAINDRNIYKDKENEDFAMMIAGKDGWLFRSHFDLKFRFKLTERTIDSFRRLGDAFRSKGTELVIVMMPTRGLVHYNQLTPQELEEFDHKAAKRSYLKMLDDMRRSGVAVADMSEADTVDNYFLKRDNHWTHEGAKFTAEAVANTIKTMPVYDELKKTDFSNKEITASQEATHRYAEFVNKICHSDIPRETLNKTFEVESLDNAQSEENLFGDESQPEITLLGTSNSTNPQPSFANFEGFLKEALRADILNQAVSGGSLQGSISNYVLNEDYKKTKPKIIIWEMSAHYGFNQQAFLREIVPSVYGDCTAEESVAEATVDASNSREPVVMENLASKNIQSNKYYVALKLDDKNQRTVKVKFTHADGRTDTTKLERSARNFPTNPGIYFIELSDVMEAPLDKISLELKEPGGTARAHICKVPQIKNSTPVNAESTKVKKQDNNKKLSWGDSIINKFKDLFKSVSWFSPYKITVKTIDDKKIDVPTLPDLSGYTETNIMEKMPALQKGIVKIENMEGAAPLRKYAFDKRLVEFQNIQNRVEPDAIHIYSGIYDLPALMNELKDTKAIVEKPEGYLVRLPIALYPGSALIIKDLDKPLLLSQTKGAFIASAGDFFIMNSEIIGWDEKNGSPAELTGKYNIFRPFITMWDGSELYISGSHVKNLGYSLSKSYGLTISTNDVIQEEFEEEYGDLPPPSGWIINSVFDRMYFGFYTYEAKNFALIGNTYRDNIVYGIDPHDRSEKLIIAYNDVSGSKQKHGIIISRDVKDSFIIHNSVHENKGSGIMLDRNSTNNVVAFNRSWHNQGDGITLYESPDNVLYHNDVKNNDGSGIRVRNSWNIDVIGGDVSLNKDYAFQIYEDDLSGTDRDFEIDPVTPRTAVNFKGVGMASNGGILKSNSFESVRFENMNIDKNLLSRAPFGGDLKSKSGKIADYALRDSPSIEIKSGSAKKNAMPES